MRAGTDIGDALSFDDIEIDLGSFELRRAGERIPVEPLIFDLICCLANSGGRVLTRDDLINQVWDGRIVSDASVSSAIKAARKALGDTGEAQRYIRTVRGRGFQFTITPQSAQPETPTAPERPAHDRRPSIVVVPFDVTSASMDHPALADALAHDIIQSLSRLRWIRVIARATAFQFRSRDLNLEALRQALNVRYCQTGSVEFASGKLHLTFDLIDLADHTEIWSDRISGPLDDIHTIRDTVVSQITSSVEVQIPLHEARLAHTVAPENLDAWSSFHLGLTSMYRLSEQGARGAIPHFERAISLEPGFARAHAGMSFAHFQLAFNRYPGADVGAARKQAFASAERGLALDPYDPFCNFTQGRACWLTYEYDKSLEWLKRSTGISPNFAQCHYSTALTSALVGNTEDVHPAAETARTLSPLDPFLWAFYCVRAVACIADGDYLQAQIWANKGGSAPVTTLITDLIAVIANDLAGDAHSAIFWSERARTRRPDVKAEFFIRALNFREVKTRKVMTDALRRHGF